MNLQQVEDVKKRMVQFQLDCDDGNGNAYACHSVAEFMAVVDKDHAKAAGVLETNCMGKNKYGPSCFKLGRFFLTGQGVEQSDTRAASLFQRACDLGQVRGCHHLACLLTAGGTGIKKDVPKAQKLFEQACDDSDIESCFYLGHQFLKPGPDRKPAAAEPKLLAACDLGHAPSCRLLAVMYKNGDKGVSPDAEKYEMYKDRTMALVKQRGSMMGLQVA